MKNALKKSRSKRTSLVYLFCAHTIVILRFLYIAYLSFQFTYNSQWIAIQLSKPHIVVLLTTKRFQKIHSYCIVHRAAAINKMAWISTLTLENCA